MKKLDVEKMEMKFWESVHEDSSSCSEDAVIRLDDLGRIADELFKNLESKAE